MKSIISLEESRRFIALESIVEKGKQVFVEVGVALAEIRDSRLYRADYKTFEDYCREKWGWSRVHVHRVIEAAQTVEMLPIGNKSEIRTESQARELAKLPVPQRAPVLQKIVESGKPVTAAEIRRSFPPPPMSRLEKKIEPAVVLDKTGWPIPDNLLEAWDQAEKEAREDMNQISRMKGKYKRLQSERNLIYAEVNCNSVLAHLDQIYADIKTALPYAVCPSCQGKIKSQCTQCKQRGFISEHWWERAITKESKEMREKVLKGKS